MNQGSVAKVHTLYWYTIGWLLAGYKYPLVKEVSKRWRHQNWLGDSSNLGFQTLGIIKVMAWAVACMLSTSYFLMSMPWNCCQVWHPLYAESKKKCYKWIYLQNRNRLTDLENKLVCWGVGERWRRRIVREFGMNMYALLYLKWIANKALLYSTGNSAVWGSLDGRGVGENGYMYVYGWVPLWCTWNYHKLLSSYTPIENKRLKNCYHKGNLGVLYRNLKRLGGTLIWYIFDD